MNMNEDSRLREFRQLRNTVRGSTEHLIIGIDIAKEKHHLPPVKKQRQIKQKPDNSGEEE